MKRTPLYEGFITGSFVDWPVQYSISRNEKSRGWTLYVRFTDPECRATRSHHPANAKEFLSAIEEECMDAEVFCDALESFRSAAAKEMAKEVRLLLEADSSS